MKILVIDSDTCGLDFCLRCQDAGHEIKWFITKDKGEREKAGDGLVPKVSAWEPHVRWADLIFLTHNNKYIQALDALRKEGYPVFAPSREGARMEIERGFGMEVLKKHGIDVPPYKTFNSLEEAEKYVWKTNERLVFKTLGDEEDKSMSYCPKTPADLINQLRLWQKNGKKLKGPCMLQEFIPGIEFGVSGFFGPHGFNAHWSECFEHKKLFPHKRGGVGPNTGEMGSALKWVRKSRLANLVLKPLVPYLRKIGYVGDIDVNCIIDGKGKPWPLELTCRPGYPAFWIMLSQNQGDPAAWILDLINGKDTQKVTEDVGIGVVIAQPNFPANTPDHKSHNHPIYGITDKNMKDIHLVDVMAGKAVDMVDGKPKEKEMLLTSGDYIAVVTGLGKTVSEARKACYKTVEEIHVADGFFRDDIGEHMKKDIPTLQTHSFAEEWEY
jgi:phosphoribosylamine--glycine ligase